MKTDKRSHGGNSIMSCWSCNRSAYMTKTKLLSNKSLLTG